jgi:ABC-type dipeptide/oligopeptide/nickel transport system permease subunit
MSQPTEAAAAAPPFGAWGRWRERGKTLTETRMVLIAGGVVLAMIAFCVLWPLIAPYGSNDVDFARNSQGPSWAHPLGTDQFGRDLLTRVAEGGRNSLTIAALALGIIVLIGVPYGTLSAVAGGWIDGAMMRIVDGLFAIPRLPVAIVILVGLRATPDKQTTALALSIVGWMVTARLVRGQILSLKTRNYVRAAQAVGASWTHVARRHLLPNSAGIILIALFLELPILILGEAFLAVLGLGPEPPMATWGNVAQEGLRVGRLWEMLLGSSVIAAFALAANFLVDGLHDMLDPRRRTFR